MVKLHDNDTHFAIWAFKSMNAQMKSFNNDKIYLQMKKMHSRKNELIQKKSR